MAKKKDSVKEILSFLRLLKDHKDILIELLFHPVNAVKSYIRELITSAFLLFIGLMFLLIALAEYLPSISELSKAGSYAVIGAMLIAGTLLLRVARR